MMKTDVSKEEMAEHVVDWLGWDYNEGLQVFCYQPSTGVSLIERPLNSLWIDRNLLAEVLGEIEGADNFLWDKYLSVYGRVIRHREDAPSMLWKYHHAKPEDILSAIYWTIKGEAKCLAH